MVRKAVGNNKLSAFAPPPLPKSLVLPPLPKIEDSTLYERSITHISLLGVAKNTHDLDTEHYADINDYEKLEYVGDRILSMCVDLIVNEKYPHMRQGVATMVHSNLVRNETLAQLADRYGITKKIKTSRDAQHVKNELVKVKGSAFEAWVAGVFFDYQLRGIDGATQTGKSASPELPSKQPGPPESKSTSKRQRSQSAPLSTEPTAAQTGDLSSPKTATSACFTAITAPLVPTFGQGSYGEAMNYVFAWLKPLYLPILDFIFDEMRKYKAKIDRDEAATAVKRAEAPKAESPESAEEKAAGGALLALTTLCENQYKVKPLWTDERARPGVWRLTCKLTLPDGRQITKSGEKPTKKLAKAMAALEVCRELKVMKKKVDAVDKPEASGEDQEMEDA